MTALAAVGPVAMVPAAGAHRVPACAHAHTPVTSGPRQQMTAAGRCLINRQRVERHLPRLHENALLDRTAQGWTRFMVGHDEFTHGSSFPSRITAAGYDWSMVAENIATGYPTPAAVIRGWMASLGHCRNILTPTVTATGIGVTAAGVEGFGDHGTWTEDFGLGKHQRAPSHNWRPAGACPH